jgi:hypothetical protein
MAIVPPLRHRRTELPMLPGSTRTALAVLALLLPASALAQKETEARPEQALHKTLAFEAGIVDLDRVTAYVVNPDRGIDALDIQTGKLLWHTPAGDWYWPLAVIDNRYPPDRGPGPDPEAGIRRPGTRDLLSLPGCLAPNR